jgi:hypothetical protein
MFDPYNDDDNDYIIIDELRNNKTPFFRKMSPPHNHINNEHIELSYNEKRFHQGQRSILSYSKSRS